MENHKRQAATWNKHSSSFNEHLLKYNYISKAKHREIQKRIKNITKANDGDAAYDYSLEMHKFYSRITEQANLKSKICKNIDARLDNKRAALSNKADRLMVLAKEAYLFGLLPQKDFNYLKRSLFQDRGGDSLTDQQVYCFMDSTYSDLKTSHPNYTGLVKSEEHIRLLLTSLNHYKPILP